MTETGQTTDRFIAEALAAYLECAVWCGTDWSDGEEDNPPTLESAGYSADDISADAVDAAMADVHEFILANAADIEAAGISAERVGHDFFLTRNRHGAGFWDRGLGAIGDRLTDAAHVYGEADLYVTVDGSLEF